MATKRVGTKKGKRKPTIAQKRRSRIVKAIGRWNGKRETGSRLNRKEFWEVYRDIAKKYPNTTKAVKAVREGRFALALGRAPKSVKRKTAKIIRPRRTPFNEPTALSDVYCWYDIDDSFEGLEARVQNASVIDTKTKKKVDWGKLGGYFKDDDLIILRFSLYCKHAKDFVFEWRDRASVYPAIRSDGDLIKAFQKCFPSQNINSLSHLSPQPCFRINEAETAYEAGLFVFDFASEDELTAPPTAPPPPTAPKEKAPEEMTDEEFEDFVRKERERRAKAKKASAPKKKATTKRKTKPKKKK